eukprot:14453042-Alexandrium_andersonii.AAC.1
MDGRKGSLPGLRPLAGRTPQLPPPVRGKLGWLIRARPDRAGDCWNVEIPNHSKPPCTTRYARKDSR